MISVDEMKKAAGKRVKITSSNGKILEEKCICYQQPEEDDEEPMLEFSRWLVYQSQIKSIEILD